MKAENKRKRKKKENNNLLKEVHGHLKFHSILFFMGGGAEREWDIEFPTFLVI